MGSLVSGWDSNVKDPKKVMMERNQSLTKQEISAYWKSKMGQEEVNENPENIHTGAVSRLQRSNTLPLANRRESTVNSESESGGGAKLNKTSCWWTRSNSAFLNDPPVIATEGQHKYASQHDVAKYVSSQGALDPRNN